MLYSLTINWFVDISSVAGGSDGGVEQSKERIVLQEGYIPFVLVGYVDARGGIDTLRWAPRIQRSRTTPS